MRDRICDCCETMEGYGKMSMSICKMLDEGMNKQMCINRFDSDKESVCI
jgi:hypothetical protein